MLHRKAVHAITSAQRNVGAIQKTIKHNALQRSHAPGLQEVDVWQHRSG